MSIAFFLLGAILCTAGSRLIHKYVLSDVGAYAYSLFTTIVASILFLPLAFSSPRFSFETYALAALLIASVLWTLVSVVSFLTYKKTELSLREPISQTRALWVLLLGTVFLGEPFTALKASATLLICAGLLFLLYHPIKKWSNLTHPGVVFTFFGAILPAFVAIVDKYSLKYFDPGLYGFLVYIIPAIFLLAFLPGRKAEVSYLLNHKWRSALAGAIISTLGYFCILKVYESADLTLSYPLLQLSSLLVVVCGIFLFKEKEFTLRKIIATIVILLGVVLLKFS